MDITTHIIALSGGKDSTAMALRMMELEPERNYRFLVTPTGDELPEMAAHWERLGTMLGGLTVRHDAEYPTIYDLISHFRALPNFRQRWCTRLLKIEVAQKFYAENMPAVVYVGLRADEAKRRGNKIFDGNIEQRFPLREWGWGLADVLGYLERRGVNIPRRTDCAMCFWQRIDEWWTLWKEYPKIFNRLVGLENELNKTLLTPGKFGTTWPHRLSGLAEEFSRGRMPKKIIAEQSGKCRICSL